MAKLRRTEQVPKEVTYGYRCDNCRKEDKGERTRNGDIDQPDGWHHFTSHHNDWENDSVETWKDHDACSWACYLAIVRKIFDDYGEPPMRGGAPRVPVRACPTLDIDERDWYFIRDMLAHQSEGAKV